MPKLALGDIVLAGVSSMGGLRGPRAGQRFGFHGSSNLDVENREATVDDILESLGRHTQLADSLSMREAREPGEESDDFFNTQVPSFRPPIRVRGSFGRYAFSLMLFGGVAVLVLYGFFSMILGPSSTPVNAGRSLLSLIVNDPVKLGLLGILCLVPVVMARRRRGRVERQLEY